MASPGSSRSPAQRLGGWGSMPQDLVARLAAFLPIRERFGVLPQLNRHYYATSQQWEIGGLGISDLFLPATRLTTQAVQQRSQGVQDWLVLHSTQLARLRCDLLDYADVGGGGLSDLFEYKHLPGLRTLIQPAVLEAQWAHRTAFESVVLMGSHLDAALESAQGSTSPADGLGACAGLRSLHLFRCKASTAQLAALVESVPSAGPELRLTWKGYQTELRLAKEESPPDAFCRSLRAMDFQSLFFGLGVFQPPFLPKLTRLTTLDLNFVEAGAELSQSITQLSGLAKLRLYANWPEVPAALGQLRVRTLCLMGLQVPRSTPVERLNGGMRALAGLAPTLQALQLQVRQLMSLPVAISSLSGLTRLEVEEATIPALPLWLSRLAGLERLHMGRDSLLNPPSRACLEGLPALRSLDVWWCDLVDPELSDDLPLSRLTKLGFGPGMREGWAGGMVEEICLESLQDASSLRELTLHGDVERDLDTPGCTLQGASFLNDLSSLTSLRMKSIKGSVVPPEGSYLSRLRSLEIKGDHNTACKLPTGLSAATGLTRLFVENYSYGLDGLWEQLEEMLPCWPLLQEVRACEESNANLPMVDMLAADLLDNMGA